MYAIDLIIEEIEKNVTITYALRTVKIFLTKPIKCRPNYRIFKTLTVETTMQS